MYVCIYLQTHTLIHMYTYKNPLIYRKLPQIVFRPQCNMHQVGFGQK